MKNLIVLVLVFLATVCSAQIELEGNKEGSYRIKENYQEWAPSGITAELQAIEHINRFSQAINSPGNPILVAESKKILKLKPVFKKQVEVREYFILYNSQTNNIDYVEAIPTIKEEPFYLILFSITSILLMIISNVLFKKGRDGFAVAYSFSAAAVALAAAALAVAYSFSAALVAAYSFSAALAAAGAALAAAVDKGYSNKNYKTTSIIFYILMVIHIVLLFV